MVRAAMAPVSRVTSDFPGVGLRTATALLIVMLVAAGCSKRETAVDIATRDNVLLLGNGGDPPDLDPQLSVDIPSDSIILSLFEGLVRVDPTDLHPVPGIASSWDVSEDGKVYTFHLRPDARWSNGEPVTAADFYLSFQRLLSPALASQNADQLSYVVGAQEFSLGRQPDFSKVGFRVVDPATLVITLKDRTPFFPQLLAERYAMPVPISVLGKFGGTLRRGSPWTRPENMVCDGPFVLKAWVPGRFVEVARSPTYWDRGHVKLGAVRFFPIEEPHAEEAAFRSGQLHVTETIPTDRLDVYRAERSPLLRMAPFSGVYFYAFNVLRPPFDDVRVRRALAMALNRGRLVRDVTRAGETPAYSFTPDGLDGFTSATRIAEDAAGARELMAAAGYPGGRGFPKVSLLYNTSDSHRAIAEAIQQMWRSSLNVEVDLYNQEWKVYLDNLHIGNYQVGREGLIIDPFDPYQYLRNFETGYGYNYTGWSNPDFDRLLEGAWVLRGREERFAQYQKAEAILLRDVPIIPIYFYTQHYLIRPEVRDWPSNLVDLYPLGQAFLQN